MIDENNIILPSKYDNGIYKCRCGISFAIKYDISKKINFKNSKYEDYYYLKELEYRNYKIVISSYVSYFVRREPTECEILDNVLINF